MGGGLVIRADSNVAGLIPAATRIVRRIAPRAPIDRVMTVAQIKDQSLSPRRQNAALISSFGILAVVIAIRRGRLERTVGLTTRLLGRRGEMKMEIESPAEHNRFSYGPAIAIGCIAAMLIGDSL